MRPLLDLSAETPTHRGAGAHRRTKHRPGGPAHFMAFMGAAAFIALASVFTSFFRRMAFMGAAAFIALAKVLTVFFRRMAFMGAAAFIALAKVKTGGDEMTEEYTEGDLYS